LLEYDNVMNSQREVIYKRRRNALFGERLELDILTMLYDTCEDMVINAKNASDYESLRLNALSTLGQDYEISRDTFDKLDQQKLTDDLYHKALEHYHRKNKIVAEKALPIFRDLFKSRGATVDNIMVPFSDGQKQIGVVANLAKTLQTGNAELIKGLATIKDSMDSGAFQAIQEAAMAALEDPASEAFVKDMRALYKRRRDLFVDAMTKAGWKMQKPSATFYVWARTPKSFSSTETAGKILDEVGVVCTPGVGFGPSGEGYVRFALSVEEKRMMEAVERIQKVKWTK